MYQARKHEMHSTLIYITFFMIANIIGQANGQATCDIFACVSCNANECQECSVDFHMGVDDLKQCSDCADSCADCSKSITTCTECTESGFGPKAPADGTCSPCADQCDSCQMDGPGTCDPSGCLPKFAYDANTKSCQPCAGVDCPGCTVPNTCPTCVDGYGRDGSGQPIGDPQPDGTQPGCKKCEVLHAAQCTPDYKLLVTCMDGYHENYTLNKCEPICATVTREEWMAAPAKEGTISILPHPVLLIIIHHTKSAFCYTFDTCLSVIRGIQKQHQSTTPTSTNACCMKDIAYNYLIGEDGSVYDGRGMVSSGEHTKGSYTVDRTTKTPYNIVSYGIAFIGDFTMRAPNKKALDALRRFLSTSETNPYAVGYGCSDPAHFDIDPMYRIYNHWDLDCTKCPGGKLRAAMKQQFSDHYHSTTIDCPGRVWKHPMKK